MKKILSLLLILVLTVLAACTSTDSQTNSSDRDVGGEAGATGDNAANGKVKIVCLVNGTLGDKSFFDSCARGMDEVAGWENVETKIVEAGYEVASWEPALVELSEQDWDLIITSTGDMQEIVERTAELYPDKRYVLLDSTVDAPNVYSAEFKQNEASFLAGALAALTTTSGLEGINPEAIIGVVGGLNLPIINDFIVGYIQGAQYVNPEIKVAVSYADGFGNPTKGKELALAQAGVKADVIYHVAGGTGMGVLEGVAESGIIGIGVDSDQAVVLQDSNPEISSRIITSVLKSADNLTVSLCEKFISGDLEFNKAERLGVADNAMSIVRNEIYETLTSEETRQQMDEIQQGIVDGEIKIKSAFEMAPEEITELIDTVRP